MPSVVGLPLSGTKTPPRFVAVSGPPSTGTTEYEGVDVVVEPGISPIPIIPPSSEEELATEIAPEVAPRSAEEAAFESEPESPVDPLIFL